MDIALAKAPSPDRRRSGSVAAGAALILFGTAVSAAMAVELPMAEPQAQVEICRGEAGGYFRVPGTEVCLRIGGEVYTQASAATGEEVSVTSAREDGRPVASYRTVPISDDFRGLSSHGDISVQTQTRTDQGVLHTVLTLRGTTSGSELVEGYLHWGGLTAGYRDSFFDVHTGYNETEGLSSDRTTNLLAYTFQLRPTLAVTVSVEDATFRRFQEGQWAEYAGQRIPDLVGAIDYDPEEGWWLHLAAASHHVEDARPGADATFGFAGNAGTGRRFVYSDRSSGRLVVTGAYARGALDYLGIPSNAPDYIRDELDSLRLSQGYSGLVSYEHFWSPEIRTAATASFYRTRTEAGSLDWNTEGFWLTLGTEYIPVPGFNLGLDVTYFRDAVWAEGPGQAPPAESESVVGFGYARRIF
jgi:hypothetical protein